MQLNVKICGLTTPEDATFAVDQGATMLGLVFFPPSPRAVTIKAAQKIVTAIDDTAARVGLFVNPTLDDIANILDHMALTHIQLHGRESAERVRAIKHQFALPVIKAIGLSTRADIAQLSDYEDEVDMFLFDAKPPKTSNRPGGLGQTFDWTVLTQVKTSRPWLLSGGLTPLNIQQAINLCRPLACFAGVDVSTGVELRPGKKDKALIGQFLAAATR
ncbi:MAG: phosphoribosylanthranilate isomerase [bacterium]